MGKEHKIQRIHRTVLQSIQHTQETWALVCESLRIGKDGCSVGS